MSLTEIVSRRHSVVALDPKTGEELATIHLTPAPLDYDTPYLVTAHEVTIPAGCALEYRTEAAEDIHP